MKKNINLFPQKRNSKKENTKVVIFTTSSNTDCTILKAIYKHLSPQDVTVITQ